MGIVIVGFIVGVAYLVATLFQVKKSAKNLEDVDLKKYTKVDNSKTYIYFLILLSIFSLLSSNSWIFSFYKSPKIRHNNKD